MELSVGAPGREKSVRISNSYAHLSSIFPADSEPLSVFRSCGNGCHNAKIFSISATSEERRFWPTQIHRHSREQKSITVSRLTVKQCGLANMAKIIEITELAERVAELEKAQESGQ
ncbi:hypothetical protein [Pantoea dispersa]|uniref:hypothetical protein n=1 Tax=Pantoea dispersa TaxID=59814 RepID=UPI001F524940|nr:hypothetical protein [Pantoea dispersa]MCI1030174.1 hypothetical protein [Pantoea dispersa]